MENQQKNRWHNDNQPYEYHNKYSRKPLKPWLIGLVFIVIGSLFGYYSIIRVLQQMAERAESVKYSVQGVLIGPFMLVSGLFLLFAPKDIAAEVMKPGGKSKWIWLVFIIVGGCCVLTYFLFKHQAAKYGYTQI